MEGSRNGTSATRITDEVLAADRAALEKAGIGRQDALMAAAATQLGSEADHRLIVHAAAELARQATP